MSQFLLSWDTKEQEHPGAIGSAYLSQQSGNSLELPGKLGICALAQKKKNKNPWHEFLPKGKWNKYGLEDQWHRNVMIPTGPACLTLRETFKINTWFYISWSWISHLTLKSADGNSELPFHRKLRFFIPTLRGENFFCRVYFPLTFCWLLPNIPIFILWKSACKSVKCYWRIQFI